MSEFFVLILPSHKISEIPEFLCYLHEKFHHLSRNMHEFYLIIARALLCPSPSPTLMLKLTGAYRTRPHRRHGSASEDQVISVTNKQIYLFWLSEAFQIPFEDVDWSRRHCFIVKIVPIIDNSLWEKVLSQVRLIDFD